MMQTKTEKLKNSELKLIISLDKEELDFYKKETEKKIANEIKIDGFRKGKVPSEIIKNKVGDKTILEESTDTAIKASFVQALRKEKLDVIETLEIKVTKNTPELLEYEAALLVFPEIILGDYKNISVKKEVFKVTEQEIENTLNFIRKSRAKYQKTNGPVKKGDKVEVDFEVKHDGKLIDGGKSKNHPVVVGDNKFIPGFEDELLDMKEGNEKTFNLTAPKDYYQKSIAGKKLSFFVKIGEVGNLILPEINDEFAKELGNFSGVEMLKLNIKSGIKMEKENKEKEKIRVDIMDKIESASKIETPPRLIEKQLDAMVENFGEKLKNQGLELGLYLAKIGKTQDEIRKEWKKQAEKQVKISLILREISKKEKIEVSEEEVLQGSNEILSGYRTIQEANGQIDLNLLKDRLRASLLNEKIFNFLEKNAKVL